MAYDRTLEIELASCELWAEVRTGQSTYGSVGEARAQVMVAQRVKESLTLVAPARARVLPRIVQEHALEAATLFVARCRLVSANDVRLEGLARHDERIEAHLDGLRVAAEGAHSVLLQLLADPDGGSMFVLAAMALNSSDVEQLISLLQHSKSSPDAVRGILGALGWTSRSALRGVVAGMLRSADNAVRLAATAACGMHRVDPMLPSLLADPDVLVRARALRLAGELGQRELLARLADATQDVEPVCSFWAAWSAVLCGDRQQALVALAEHAFASGRHANQALQLLMQASSEVEGHRLLQLHGADPANIRTLIAGAAFVGDPLYVPWLLVQMANPQTARIAGWAVGLITGLDLWQPPFFQPPLQELESGPTEDPADENVDMDEDDGLPWPNQAQLQAWWQQNGARFTVGARHFMGQPPSPRHCQDVLEHGYQRQRIAAAYHLCLLSPGRPLFEWRARASRQQQVLAQMC